MNNKDRANAAAEMMRAVAEGRDEEERKRLILQQLRKVRREREVRMELNSCLGCGNEIELVPSTDSLDVFTYTIKHFCEPFGLQIEMTAEAEQLQTYWNTLQRPLHDSDAEPGTIMRDSVTFTDDKEGIEF